MKRAHWGQATIYGDTTIGEGTYLGDHVVVGHPGKEERELLVRGAADDSSGAKVGRDCVLRAHGVLYAGATFGDRVQTGHHWLVREGTTVGDGTLVGSGTIVDDNCTIGSKVSIQTGVYVPTGTVIEDHVFLGPRVCITNDKKMGRGDWKLEGVTVRRGARVGANSTLLPGIEIGADALIGAGAVVTRDVPAGAVVVGSPARVLRELAPNERFQG